MYETDRLKGVLFLCVFVCVEGSGGQEMRLFVCETNAAPVVISAVSKSSVPVVAAAVVDVVEGSGNEAEDALMVSVILLFLLLLLLFPLLLLVLLFSTSLSATSTATTTTASPISHKL